MTLDYHTIFFIFGLAVNDSFGVLPLSLSDEGVWERQKQKRGIDIFQCSTILFSFPTQGAHDTNKYNRYYYLRLFTIIETAAVIYITSIYV